MLTNLLLLRGNIGKPGSGLCAIRGHSNVQGQRTVGISEKPELVPLDVLAEQYGFEPPRREGFTTVTACEAMIDGRVKAFVALGGNFSRAVPDLEIVEAAWRKLTSTSDNRGTALPSGRRRLRLDRSSMWNLSAPAKRTFTGTSVSPRRKSRKGAPRKAMPM